MKRIILLLLCVFLFCQLYAQQMVFREMPVDKFEKLQSRLRANNIIYYNYRSYLAKHDRLVLRQMALDIRTARDYMELTCNWNQLETMIGLEFGLSMPNGNINWHPFLDTAVMANVINYFATNYTSFSWDSTRQIFVNPAIVAAPLTRVRELFYEMDGGDSTARAAFQVLPFEDSTQVSVMADEYVRDRIMSSNNELPVACYSMVKQLVALTYYCKAHQIDVQQEGFKDSLNMGNVSAYEYWLVTNCGNWGISGAKLDSFYSRHWSEVVNDDQQLALYLKKATLFAQLGMTGSCRLYLQKFSHNGDAVSKRLSALQTDDPDIIKARDQAITLCHTAPTTPPYMVDHISGHHLDYDHLYDLLKYEFAPSFLSIYIDKVSDSTYSILGFSKKEHNFMRAREKADAWRWYMEENHLLKRIHEDIESFGYSIKEINFQISEYKQVHSDFRPFDLQ